MSYFPSIHTTKNDTILLATININNTVSVTTSQAYSSSFHTEYYGETSKPIQDYLNPINNSYPVISPAPSKSQIMVNCIPISFLLSVSMQGP
jgi:hypothetical protein